MGGRVFICQIVYQSEKSIRVQKKVKNKSGDAQTETEIFVSKNAVLFYAEER